MSKRTMERRKYYGAALFNRVPFPYPRVGLGALEAQMYESPRIIATYEARELLGEAFGDNPGCGNEGNNKPVGNGSCEAPV